MTQTIFKLLPIDWTALQAIATGVLVFSVWYAYRTLEESKNSRAADIIMWAANQMDDVKEATFLLEKAGSDFRNWSPQEKAAAFQVSIQFQRLGYMARHDLIDKSHFQHMWGQDFVRMWAVLEEWVMNLRASKGEKLKAEDGAFSRVDFELLAKEFSNMYDVKKSN